LIPVKAMISHTLFHPKLSTIFLGDLVVKKSRTPLSVKRIIHSRFFCQKEANLQWTVWDRVADRPASLGGRELVGCTSYRASAAASL